jgi:hypothetical protein
VSDSKSSGLDASVSFESEREENAGGKQFINVTIAQVRQTPDDRISKLRVLVQHISIGLFLNVRLNWSGKMTFVSVRQPAS